MLLSQVRSHRNPAAILFGNPYLVRGLQRPCGVFGAISCGRPAEALWGSVPLKRFGLNALQRVSNQQALLHGPTYIEVTFRVPSFMIMLSSNLKAKGFSGPVEP